MAGYSIRDACLGNGVYGIWLVEEITLALTRGCRQSEAAMRIW